MNMSNDGASAACDGLVDTLDSGDIMFHTSGDAEVADCNLNATAFGAAANGVATMQTGTAVEDTNTTAGTVDHAHLRKSDTTLMTECTCGTSGTEFIFSSLTFGTGETLTVTSLTVTFSPTAMT